MFVPFNKMNAKACEPNTTTPRSKHILQNLWLMQPSMLLYLVSVGVVSIVYTFFSCSHSFSIIFHFARPLFMYFYYLIEEMHHPHGASERVYMCKVLHSLLKEPWYVSNMRTSLENMCGIILFVCSLVRASENSVHHYYLCIYCFAYKNEICCLCSSCTEHYFLLARDTEYAIIHLKCFIFERTRR